MFAGSDEKKISEVFRMLRTMHINIININKKIICLEYYFVN